MRAAAVDGGAGFVEHRRDLPRGEPGDEVAHHARAAVEARLDDDSDAADGRQSTASAYRSRWIAA